MNSSAPLLADLIVAAHRLTRIVARSTGNTTPSAVWNTLSILSTDGPLRVGELAASARVSQPGMTKVVHQLVAEGLVQRVADADDSRAWLVTVTTAGIRALEEWRNALSAALGPMFAELGVDDLAALTRAVSILTARTASEPAAA